MTAASDAPPSPRIRLRVVFGTDAMLGPGKADLLQAIAEAGSISAAARQMGMSYKRAWSLVDEMNAAFRMPLVDSARGGTRGGGAVLTGTGQEVLAGYRRLQHMAERAGADEVADLRRLLKDGPD